MTKFIVILSALFLFGLAFCATQVSVQAGPVTIKGGYVDIGTTVIASTGPATDKAGQCMGLLCAIMYN